MSVEVCALDHLFFSGGSRVLMLTAANILAGPILRRVEQDLVSVWIALTVPADVKLEIYHGVGESGNLGPEIAKKPPADKHDYRTLAAGQGLDIAVAVW